MKKILLVLALALFTTPSAFAAVCEERIGIAFTPNQRIQLCKSFGSAVNSSMIPAADNTYDLGSAAKSWRSAYIDTTIFATSILEPTADAADTALMSIAGGGSASVSRGGYLTIAGNEHANTGSVSLQSGNVAGGNINITAEHSGGSIILGTAGTSRWTLNSTGNWVATGTAPQLLGTSTTGQLTLAGGASAGVASGAYLQLGGNTHASTGSVSLQAGNVAGGNITLATEQAAADIIFVTAATTKWTMDQDGGLIGAGTGTIGWSPKAGANTACSTTCVTPCVFGIDSAAPQTWLACSDATADMCLCAGAS